jgi:fructose-bisphosphate aldolase class I
VPIIEPEVLYDGEHTIEQCYGASAHNYDALFSELRKLDVFLPGVILKTSMVLAGKDAKIKSSTEEIAKMTLKCLEKHVPAHIGGIAFLSGGQGVEEATINLNAMHQKGPLPWPLTFSYARAIQNGALEAWAKNPNDIASAQALLLTAAKNNSEASLGKYKE